MREKQDADWNPNWKVPEGMKNFIITETANPIILEGDISTFRPDDGSDQPTTEYLCQVCGKRYPPRYLLDINGNVPGGRKVTCLECVGRIEEQEACAAACDKLAEVWAGDVARHKLSRSHTAAMRAEWFAEGAKDCAKAIRARGNT